ncbi:hypothetical protein WDU94_000370 [Cyamophila willieti]
MQQRIVNMIVEVPSMQKKKMEISLNEYFNPVREDTRPYMHNTVYLWNYGSLPNTWENPDDYCLITEKKGDGNPLDVFDIGQYVAKRGEVLKVKVLGCLGITYRGRIDYKIMGINVNDPNAVVLKDIKDIHKLFPGFLNRTLEWFEHYNVPFRKKKNTIAYNGEIRDRKFALDVIEKAMQKWILLAMIRVTHPNISMVNTISGQEENEYKISFKEAEEVFDNVMDMALVPYSTKHSICHNNPTTLVFQFDNVMDMALVPYSTKHSICHNNPTTLVFQFDNVMDMALVPYSTKHSIRHNNPTTLVFQFDNVMDMALVPYSTKHSIVITTPPP